MSYTPNNPYIPGDPFSYDLKWIVAKLKEYGNSINSLMPIKNIFNQINSWIDKSYTDYITPEFFGAYGDGVHDDSAPLQTAINSGKKVICNNTYIIDDIINLPDNTFIEGNGKIVYKNSVAFYSDGHSNITISGLTFDGVNLTDNTLIRAIHLKDCRYINIDKCNFVNSTGIAIECEHSDFCTIQNNYIDSYYYSGIMLSEGCQYCYVTNNTVLNGYGAYPNLSVINRYPISLSAYRGSSNFIPTKFIYCSNNTIIDVLTAWEGIDAHTLQNSVIANNVIKGTLTGIAVTTISYPNVPITENVVIANNIIELGNNRQFSGNANSYGILAAWTDSALSIPDAYKGGVVEISGNIIRNANSLEIINGGAILTYGLKATITNNRILSPHGNVFYLPYNVEEVLISNNIVTDYIHNPNDASCAYLRINSGTGVVYFNNNKIGDETNKNDGSIFIRMPRSNVLLNGKAVIGKNNIIVAQTELNLDNISLDKYTGIPSTYAAVIGDTWVNKNTGVMYICTADGDYDNNTLSTFASINTTP